MTFKQANRLVSRVEQQWETIAHEVITQLRKDHEAGYYRTLPEHDVRARALDLVRNLGKWLESENNDELRERYEALGELRRKEGVPLADVLYKVFLLKRKIRSYAMLNNHDVSAPALYEELELLRRVGQCFDMIACHLARGYQEGTSQARERNVA